MPKNNGSSPPLINKCIDALRRLFDIAVERGQLAGNPLYPRGLKLKNSPRKPHLPEAAPSADSASLQNRLRSGNRAGTHPCEVFRLAVIASACAIICVHQHPSGDPAPSSADLQITWQFREAGMTLETPLIDHVVIGNPMNDLLGGGWYSFRETGVL
jgi:hypothetical protein